MDLSDGQITDRDKRIKSLETSLEKAQKMNRTLLAIIVNLRTAAKDLLNMKIEPEPKDRNDLRNACVANMLCSIELSEKYLEDVEKQ